MTVRDDVLPPIDEARSIIGTLGFRPYTLTIAVRSWSGSVPLAGTATVESYAITPAPKVRAFSVRELDESGGRYQEGDRRVFKITPRYISPTTGGYFPRPTLSTPATPTVSPEGATGATTYRYKYIAFQGARAVSPVSAAGSTSTGNASLSASNFNRVTGTAVSGATLYAFYRTAGGATQGLIGTSTSPTLDDTGLVADGTAALPPVLLPAPLAGQDRVFVLTGREGAFDCEVVGDVIHDSLGYELTLRPKRHTYGNP